MSQFSSTTTRMFSVDDVVFEGGDHRLLDRRDADYNQAPRAAADHDNGTEESARTWARDFYLGNKAFLRASIKTRRALAFFFKTWYSSRAADDTRANVPLRPFNQILYALCNDGKVLHLRNYDHKRGRLRDPVIVWHKERDASTKTDFDKAVADAVEKALNGGAVDTDPKSPESYTPTTPPRPTRPASTNAPARPPTLSRQMTNVGDDASKSGDE
tara:strand:- start:388 stop:1032 length:645 start_codon:yes stop_codon:yes gene_type:complete